MKLFVFCQIFISFIKKRKLEKIFYVYSIKFIVDHTNYLLLLKLL